MADWTYPGKIMADGVNIDSVAKASGFSKSTVSRAIHNDPRVAPQTRELIMEVVASMGYRPNPLVAALMRTVRTNRAGQDGKTIALLTFLPKDRKWRDHPSQRMLIQGIYKRAPELGFRVEEYPVLKGGLSSKRLNEVLLTRGIRGVIIAPMHHSTVHLELEWSRFSLVTTGLTVQSPRLHRVRADGFQNLHTAMERLAGYGYRRIGLVIDKTHSISAQEMWLGGYLTYSLRRFGVQNIPPLLIPSDESLSGAAFQRQLRSYIAEHRIEAVIGFSSLLQAMLDGGMRIPDECAFASLVLGEGESAAGMDEKLEGVGSGVVNLLADLLYRNEQGPPLQPQTILVEGEWVDGWTAPRRRARRTVRPCGTTTSRTLVRP